MRNVRCQNPGCRFATAQSNLLSLTGRAGACVQAVCDRYSAQVARTGQFECPAAPPRGTVIANSVYHFVVVVAPAPILVQGLSRRVRTNICARALPWLLVGTAGLWSNGCLQLLQSSLCADASRSENARSTTSGGFEHRPPPPIHKSLIYINLNRIFIGY